MKKYNNGQPITSIETSRLLIRPPVLDDAGTIKEMPAKWSQRS